MTHKGLGANRGEKNTSFYARDEKVSTQLNSNSTKTAYEQRNNIVDVADEEIKKIKNLVDSERQGQMTKGARGKLNDLAEELTKPFKVMRNQGFEKINTEMRTYDGSGDADALATISNINSEYSEKIQTMSEVIQAYVQRMKEGGTDISSIDYDDISRLWASDVQAVKHVSEILLSNDKELCDLFNLVLEGSLQAKDNLEVLDKYLEADDPIVSPWTVVSYMDNDTKDAFTKRYLKKESIDKKKFFKEGIKRGVYSIVEAEKYYPDMYKDDADSLLEDQKAYTKSKDLSKFVDSIKNYMGGTIELNNKSTINDVLSPGGILKTGATLLAVTNLFTNFLLNATADGGFSIYDGVVHGMGNVYGMSSILALFGLKMSKNDWKMREMLKTKKEEASEASILGEKDIKALSQKKAINDFLRTKKGKNTDDRGSKAMAEFVASEGDVNDKNQSLLNLNHFKQWLRTKKGTNGKVEYEDLVQKLDENDKAKAPVQITQKEFRTLFLSYNNLGLEPRDAARFDKKVLNS